MLADMKELGKAINAIKIAWSERDYATVDIQSRMLLHYEPENVYGLLYLARSAHHLKEYEAAAATGRKLVNRSPREAFAVASRLNRAQRHMAAARIFAELNLGADWVDDKISARKKGEALRLERAGAQALARNEPDIAKICWVASLRLEPENSPLQSRVNQMAKGARKLALEQNLNVDRAGYINAWNDVLWFNPRDVLALARLARAYEGNRLEDSIKMLLQILTIDASREKVGARVRKLVERNDLEQHAIRCLVELGHNQATMPLIQEFMEKREAKNLRIFKKEMRNALRQAMAHARAIDGDGDLRAKLDAWKGVLVLDPGNLVATRKVIRIARNLNDDSELLEALIAHLEIVPGEEVIARRLAKAALSCRREERALEYLARCGMASMDEPYVLRLRERVLDTYHKVMRGGELEQALKCFHALELMNCEDPVLEVIRPALANRAAACAKAEAKEDNLGAAISLAEEVLGLDPSHASALTIVCRNLWRHKRYTDIIETCRMHIKPGPRYKSLHRLLLRAEQQITHELGPKRTYGEM